MSIFARASKSFVIGIRRPTLIEFLVIVAIITVLAALLIPPVQWASSGDIDVPVRVFVFDADLAIPIEGAVVGIIRCQPWSSDEFLKDYRDRVPTDVFDAIDESVKGTTSPEGIAVISYRFRTGASHTNPVTWAHTSWYWVAVKAEGYGGAFIPVRHESTPNKKLREDKELRVPVGLMPTK